MERWHYHYAGLQVTSDLLLPEWSAFESARPFDVPDVVIRIQREPSAEHPSMATAEPHRFRIEDVGDYCVSAGREIVIALQPGAGMREARLFLLGSAWGALCYQRGILVLHSSVVRVQEHAVAFCGARGAGKSSVAAWLAARGHALVCDDLCHVDADAEWPRVYPAAPRLKLWRDALHNLGWSEQGMERDHFRMDKFHVPSHDRGTSSPSGVPLSPLPLRAIYLLGWGEIGLTRLTGLAALRQLIESATYRSDLLEPMGQLAAHWRRCAVLARRVPVFGFTRPCDWPAMDSAMQRLITQWADVFDGINGPA